MFVQLSIGRAKNNGTYANYDEWRHFVGNAQTLVKGLIQDHSSPDALVRDPEVHEGIGDWIASGREESAHISAYTPDVVELSHEALNVFISAVEHLATQHWQDAIAVTIVQGSRGINELIYANASYSADHL